MAFLDETGLNRLWQQIVAKLGTKADATHNHTGLQSVKTSGTGAAYTATVDGITSLTKGVNFIMVPHTQSTTKTPTLNVNGLGAKTIQRYVSANDYSTEGYNESWLQSTRPVLVIYSGTYWYVQAMDKPAAYDLRGTVPIASGGTGATTAADAMVNLGVDDYVVDEGTSGNWSYRKWNSGYAECIARVYCDGVTCTTTWGNMYYSPTRTSGNYPFSFTSNPSITISSEGARDCFTIFTGSGSSTAAPNWVFVSPTSISTNFVMYTTIRAEGRWK